MVQLRALRRVASVLTSPLAPEDFLSLVNPLASTRQLRGLVTRVVPETADSATIHFRPGKGWNALLRLYGPLEPWFDKSWKPGDFELVK